MTDLQQGSALINLLNEKTSVLKQLKLLLETEKQILIENNPESLLKITQEKDSLLTKLTQLAEKITTLLGPQKPKIAKEDKELNTAWENFLTALRECRLQNNVNGTVIHVSLNNIKRTISLFKGKSSTPDLYTKKGLTESQASSSGHIKI